MNINILYCSIEQVQISRRQGSLVELPYIVAYALWDSSTPAVEQRCYYMYSDNDCVTFTYVCVTVFLSEGRVAYKRTHYLPSDHCQLQDKNSHGL